MTPPPSYPRKEGNTEVDALLLVPSEAVIFVEAKYKSKISKRTTHDPDRDQIIRNLDVGTYYASKNKLDFYFILLTSQRDWESRQFLKQDPKRPNPSHWPTEQTSTNSIKYRVHYVGGPERSIRN